MPPLTDDIATQLTELGRWIGIRRIQQGMSLEDVSRAAGVSVMTIMRIEAGNGGVGAKNLLAVMAQVGLPAIADDSPILQQATLPVHALHVDSDEVQLAIEDAAKLACERLEELFPDAKPESEGISSNFQGLLVQHLAAMLRGQPHHRVTTLSHLKPLVYSDVDLGADYILKEGANGFLVRLVDTPKVLEERAFRLAHRVGDMYSSWEDAAAAVRDYIETQGHLPGQVRIVHGWWSDGETGVRFTPPASK